MNRLFGAPKTQPQSKPQQGNPQPQASLPKAQLPEKSYDLSETSKRVCSIKNIFIFLKFPFKRWRAK